jgi:thioesterase domain-containing protein
MKYTPIVAINTGSRASAPIFCVPGAAASVSIYMELAEAIESKVPMYGLEPRGLDGRTEPHSSVEEAAAEYLPAVLAMHPRGPYRLLGHSFGGWVCFEMALQFKARHLPVEDLWLIDSDVPTPSEQRQMTLTAAVMELVKMYEMRFHRPLHLSADAFCGQGILQAADTLKTKLVLAKMLHRKFSVELFAACLHVFQVNLNTGYVPSGAISSTVHLINAAATEDDLNARVEGWRNYAPNVRAETVPGNHMSVLRQPAVKHIGDWLVSSWRGAMSLPAAV